jgi:NAD-dependent dihydropyrimidine dehydrogenase PreA subunit
MPDPRGGYPSSSTPASALPRPPTGPAPGASETLARIRLPLPPVLHAREVSLVAEALCRCSQLFGRHAETCPSRVVIRDRRLSDALEAHDRRVLAADPETCASCRQPLDPDNLCRVNGIGYHLGNCPQPHGAGHALSE